MKLSKSTKEKGPPMPVKLGLMFENVIPSSNCQYRKPPTKSRWRLRPDWRLATPFSSAPCNWLEIVSLEKPTKLPGTLTGVLLSVPPSSGEKNGMNVGSEVAEPF